MNPSGANLGHPDDLIDDQELKHQLGSVNKAMEPLNVEDRDEPLLEGLMRFGLRFLPTVGKLARMRNKEGPLQDLATRTVDIMMDWLDGKKMTERADEDECRASLAMTILETPKYMGLWCRASNAIMTLPEGHRRRDISLVRRSLLAFLNLAQEHEDIDGEAAAISDLLGYKLLPVDRSLEVLDYVKRLLDKISTPSTSHNLFVQAIGFCTHFAFKARDSGDTKTQQLWASRAAEFLDRMMVKEPDLLEDADGKGLYAVVMELNGKSSETLRALAEAVDKSSPQELAY
ncbi:MAG TPA: hypothetical protein VEQ40_09765, partial [Pyrinomonadaceae bacterium]|nr:hypothetical protein [Pyrinomonadaceae bacterium]